MSPVEGGESKLFKCLTVNLMCEECKVESSIDRASSVDIRKSNKMEDVDENKEIDVKKRLGRIKNSCPILT